MPVLLRFLNFSRGIRRHVFLIRTVARHARTPWLARWCVLAAVLYLLMPFDLVPDVLPLLGQLDDTLIIPALLVLAYRLIPQDVIMASRALAVQNFAK